MDLVILRDFAFFGVFNVPSNSLPFQPEEAGDSRMTQKMSKAPSVAFFQVINIKLSEKSFLKFLVFE